MDSSLKLPYEEIRAYIRAAHPQAVVMFGCDSVRKEGKKGASARYSTVVCIHNASGSGDDIMYHGCKVFGASVVLPDYGTVIKSGKMANLRQRLMQEVTFVLEAFENLKDDLGDRPWEIHLDINSREEAGSQAVLNEARGYVMGMTGGYVPAFKPNALAASFAADMHAHGMFD